MDLDEVITFTFLFMLQAQSMSNNFDQVQGLPTSSWKLCLKALLLKFMVAHLQLEVVLESPVLW